MKFTKEQIEFIKEKGKELEKKTLSGGLLKKPERIEQDPMGEMIMNLTGAMFINKFSEALIKELEVEGE